MKKILIFICLAGLSMLFSCSEKPSDKDISRKILLDYVCAEVATVLHLKIINIEETNNVMGKPTYLYRVSGDVVWPDGCSELGSQIRPGATQNFTKTLTLSKTQDGDWH